MKVRIKTNKLSDGSLTFDVIVECDQGVGSAEFSCADSWAAQQLVNTLRHQVVGCEIVVTK